EAGAEGIASLMPTPGADGLTPTFDGGADDLTVTEGDGTQVTIQGDGELTIGEPNGTTEYVNEDSPEAQQYAPEWSSEGESTANDAENVRVATEDQRAFEAHQGPEPGNSPGNGPGTPPGGGEGPGAGEGPGSGAPPTDATPPNGPESTSETYYSFGGSPNGPNPGIQVRLGTDIAVDENGMVSSQDPTQGDAQGKSGTVDPANSGLKGHYYSLPQGTELSDGIGVIRDGADVNGRMPAGHVTFYPTIDMSFDEFNSLVHGLPWIYAGKI
ncbi:MAG TPA: hypothetical protein VIC85_18380, partial [Ktedonobacterales bacterium]